MQRTVVLGIVPPVRMDTTTEARTPRWRTPAVQATRVTPRPPRSIRAETPATKVARATKAVARATKAVARATKAVARATKVVARATKVVAKATKVAVRETKATKTYRATRAVARATKVVARAIRAHTTQVVRTLRVISRAAGATIQGD